MFTSVSTLFTLRFQSIPIKFVLEGPLAEVGVHGPPLEPKVHRRAEVLGEAPERHAQELPIFREEALSINESASDDVLLFEGWTVGLKSGFTYFLAAGTRVGVGVLTPARQSEIPAIRIKADTNYRLLITFTCPWSCRWCPLQ